MTYLKHILLYAFCLHINFFAIAQEATTVSGNIYDLQSRQSLQGATIETKDGTSTTLSDRAGRFKIKTKNKEGELFISLIGYKKQVVRYHSQYHDLNIQMETDPISLNEIRVTSFGYNKTNKETAGSVAYISSRQLRQGNGVSLQPALNSIPGVHMDQSTLSESRISIRGNGVRAPWGIRDIKIYVNDIPLTEADGTSRIEALDVDAIGQAEVIKGPASSIYGAGNGGVINFQLQRSPYQEQSAEVSSLVGYFGLQRVATTYRNGGDKMNSYISYGWQQLDGYRSHSNDLRHFITGNFQIFPSDKRIITILISRSIQHTQIPGSLTMKQVSENRKQANADNLAKQAGRKEAWTRVGISQQYRFNDKLSNATSVFTYFYDLNHPLPFAYIRNFYQSYGGRTRFNYDPGFAILPTKFTVGMELNQGRSKGTQYVNDQGHEGIITGNTDYLNTVYSVFYQSETHLSPKTTLVAGISLNGVTYNAHDYLHEESSGIKRFKPQLSPRIALSHNFGKALSLHGSVSTGFSAPTTSEIEDEHGSINKNLQAERGIDFEINAKGNLLHERLGYDLSLFSMDMKGELIGQNVQQGITVYRNAGKTKHNGIELALNYKAINESEDRYITMLRPFAAITYSDFWFKDYKVLDEENEVKEVYNNNKLTGIAPWMVSAGVNIETKAGIYFYGSYFFNGRLPLNDANTEFNASYNLLNSRIGFKKDLSKHFKMELYGGVNNITNSLYSSMTSLNAIANGGDQPAYFNPSPTKNGYLGLNFKYIF